MIGKMPEDTETEKGHRSRLMTADLVKGIAITGMVILHLALLQDSCFPF